MTFSGVCLRLAVSGVLAALSADAYLIPQPARPKPPTFSVSHRGTFVEVVWRGGTPPFAVVRESEPNEEGRVDLTYIGTELRTRRFVDREVPDGCRFWYRVFDVNSEPEVFHLTPDGVLGAHDRMVFTGVGFSDECGDIVLMLGGADLILNQCSWNRIEATVPLNAYSGSILLATPTGSCDFNGWQHEKAKTWKSGVVVRRRLVEAE